MLVAGDRSIDGAEIKSFGGRECLEAVQHASAVGASRGSLPEGEGIGVAVGFWPGGLEPAAAICKLDGDGKLTVVTAASDMSGIENAFIAIAAETFGLAEDSVRVAFGDTSATPYGGIAGGSKITYTYGRAIKRAAEAARERLLDVAALRARDRARGPRAGRRRGPAPRRPRPRGEGIADLAAKTYPFGSPHAPIEGYGGVAQVSRAPGAAAHLSHVRVDRETGAVTVLAHVIAQDVGKALNPALVEGQMPAAPPRASAGRCSRSSPTTRTASSSGGSFAEYALPSTDQVPPMRP